MYQQMQFQLKSIDIQPYFWDSVQIVQDKETKYLEADDCNASEIKFRFRVDPHIPNWSFSPPPGQLLKAIKSTARVCFTIFTKFLINHTPIYWLILWI